MAEGTPTANTAKILSLEGRPAWGRKVRTLPFPIRISTPKKNKQAMQLERAVAIPAPNTS